MEGKHITRIPLLGALPEAIEFYKRKISSTFLWSTNPWSQNPPLSPSNASLVRRGGNILGSCCVSKTCIRVGLRHSTVASCISASCGAQGLELNPGLETEHILYSNRSACYCLLEDFERALADANQVVAMKPDWTKVVLVLCGSVWQRVAACILEYFMIVACQESVHARVVALPHSALGYPKTPKTQEVP